MTLSTFEYYNLVYSENFGREPILNRNWVSKGHLTHKSKSNMQYHGKNKTTKLTQQFTKYNIHMKDLAIRTPLNWIVSLIR